MQNIALITGTGGGLGLSLAKLLIKKNWLVYVEYSRSALVIECLNGYRIKEKMPSNIGDFCTPLGKIEVTKEGEDITLVSYGSTWRIVQEAAENLEKIGISAEVIDTQTLIPFDLTHDIVESVKKTNRILVIDEDVPGGASSYILQKIIEEQSAYQYLDSEPKTLTAKAHRPPYGKDGDYFTKPSKECSKDFSPKNSYILSISPCGSSIISL